MNLPWLELQAVYASIAWATVLSACGVSLLARWLPDSPRAAGVWPALVFAACAIPGEWSPDHWLRLSFNLPSPLLMAFCGLSIRMNLGARVGKASDGPRRVMPAGLAAALAGIGALLYADSVGWVHLGLYVRGFGAEAAFAGLLVSGAAVLAIATGLHRATGFAVLGALMSYALLRLPTGNVWDALLDPLLWLWAIGSLIARAWACRATPAVVAVTQRA